MYKIVLIRHGESLGNIENRFTGLLDVDITKKGFLESYKVGVKLKNLKYNFDICYTSKLKRAIKTGWIILESMNLLNIKIINNSNLNERSYGYLSGMNKLESILNFDKIKINNWLNNYNEKPPKILYENPKNSLIYENFKKKSFFNESLSDLSKKIITFWKNIIIKKIKKHKILIVAHSNVIKILSNYIDKKNNDLITGNSKAIVYEFDNNLEKIKKYIL